MKAVVLERPGQFYFKQDFPDPVPEENEVIVKVLAVSVCGSDIRRIVNAEAHTYPMILGHEIVGNVTALGEGVDKKWKNKRVAIIPLIPCMKCDRCLKGYYSACSGYSFIGSRRFGGFAEELSVPQQNLYEVPADISLQKEVLIEPFSVAAHALRRAGFQKGNSISVLGCGSIGQMIIMLARSNEVGKIITSDIDSERLSIAEEFGADFVVDSRFEKITSHSEVIGDGVDISFETAGLVDTLFDAIEITKPHGVVVCLGNLPSGASLSSGLIEKIMRKEMQLCGTWMSYSSPFPGKEWEEAIGFLIKTRNNLSELISHTVKLEELPDLFEEIRAGKLRYKKIMILP